MTKLFKAILLLSSIVSSSVFATPGYHYVDATYTPGDKPGVVMKMTIKDRRAIEKIRAEFPYDDCYQGVCTYSEVGLYGHLVINFTTQNTERAVAVGENAKYTLTVTESGPHLLIQNEEHAVGWQFRP